MKQRRLVALAASLVVALGGTAPATQPAWNPVTYYGAAWSPALGAWLPHTGDGFAAWRSGRAARMGAPDYFVCGDVPVLPKVSPALFGYAARGCALIDKGTPFVYGNAGPPKGHLVYDRRHRIALYAEGCCAWESTVLALVASSPPKRVRDADLRAVRTGRGVALGMTPADVVRRYGPVALHSLPQAGGLTTLSYTTVRYPASDRRAGCGQFENFAFRRGRLVAIELLAGC